MSSIAIILDEKGALTALTDDGHGVGTIQIRENGSESAHNEPNRSADGPGLVEMIHDLKCTEIVATHIEDASLDAAARDGITTWLAPPMTELSEIGDKVKNEELVRAKHPKGKIDHPNAPHVNVHHTHHASVDRHDAGHDVKAPAKGTSDPY